MANEEHFALLRQGAETWNAWRKTNAEVRPNLGGNKIEYRGWDFRGYNLRNADFYQADLRGSQLKGADLSDLACDVRDFQLDPDLSETKFCGCNFRRAELYNVSFRQADLEGAGFSGALCIGTNFTGANLNGAWLGHAILRDTVFADNDLSTAQYLDECEHWGPSIIDSRTLVRSGPLPLSFLRGCGLSDWEIEATKLFQQNLGKERINDIVYEITRICCEQPVLFYSSFISFTESDDALAKRLYDDLWSNGVKCWRWKEDAKGGQLLMGQIDKQIRLQDRVIVICGEASLKSGPVIREIERALQREDQLTATDEPSDVLFPIRIDNAIFSWDHARQADVVAKFIPDFRNWADENEYKKAFERLLGDLKPEH